MKIERLELFGYVRLMLANIQKFVYTPSMPIQIILGTNGSGKSSVLYELSPLPAQSGQYTKEGFKRVLISHMGNEYLLESTFKHGNKHSFKKDGEELNPGGTTAVQKELVKQHFKYTVELHELLIGDTRFTEMAPMRRRDWITMLDTVDYAFPLAIYNKLRTLARDHQGTLKHLKNRLASETNALKMLSDTEGMDERANQLHAELNVLYTSKLPNLPNTYQLMSRLDGFVHRIQQLSDTVLKGREQPPEGFTFSGIQDVHDEVTRQDAALGATQNLLDRASNEYHELESVIQELGQEGDVSLENLGERIEECKQQLATLMPLIELFYGLHDVQLIRQDTNAIMDEVVSLFGALPDNKDRRYSRESVQVLRERLRAQEDIVTQSSGRLTQIARRIAMIESAKDTVCPQCSYVWREGFSEHELEQNRQWATDHEKIIAEAERSIKILQAELEENEIFAGMYLRFRSLVNNYPRLQPLWDHLLKNNMLLDNPREQLQVFSIWKRDVELGLEIEELQRKHTHLVDLSERQNKFGGASHFNQRLVKLHDEIEELTLSISKLRNQSRDIKQYRERMLRVVAAADELESVVAEFERTQALCVDSIRNEAIDQVVRSHQSDLASIQHKLTEKRTLEGVVDDLRSSHAQVDLDYEVYRVLAMELSPDEGLIAEKLSEFIRYFVEQINSIIGSVWTTDLTVLSCGIEEGNLDYKFPMQTVAADRTVPDVSKGSKAQQAIVDFAFQLTVMLYLNLEDYPLYLDEPGEGFDEQHRVNLMNFIKQLADSGRHSQLFMISHFATSHGAFTNAEVLVLDSSNIAVPHLYNQHALLG